MYEALIEALIWLFEHLADFVNFLSPYNKKFTKWNTKVIVEWFVQSFVKIQVHSTDLTNKLYTIVFWLSCEVICILYPRL